MTNTLHYIIVLFNKFNIGLRTKFSTATPVPGKLDMAIMYPACIPFSLINSSTKFSTGTVIYFSMILDKRWYVIQF
eukprot:SAG11_NODE_1283_length_5306_cov_3.174957_4_plen_76_part_00